MNRLARILVVVFSVLTPASAISAPAGPAVPQEAAPLEATCELETTPEADPIVLVDGAIDAAEPGDADDPLALARCNIIFFCTPEHFIQCGDKLLCPCECD